MRKDSQFVYRLLVFEARSPAGMQEGLDMVRSTFLNANISLYCLFTPRSLLFDQFHFYHSFIRCNNSRIRSYLNRKIHCYISKCTDAQLARYVMHECKYLFSYFKYHVIRSPHGFVVVQEVQMNDEECARRQSDTIQLEVPTGLSGCCENWTMDPHGFLYAHGQVRQF